MRIYELCLCKIIINFCSVSFGKFPLRKAGDTEYDQKAVFL